jgi:ATP-dependent DNA ligase
VQALHPDILVTMSGSAIELPRTFAPMLAAAEPLLTDEEGWAWEPKWDG